MLNACKDLKNKNSFMLLLLAVMEYLKSFQLMRSQIDTKYPYALTKYLEKNYALG